MTRSAPPRGVPPGALLVAGALLPAIIGCGGDTVSLRSLRGEVVLLNVWATWCTPCREEMPELEALRDAFGSRGLRVVGVSVDREGVDERIREFLRETGVEYTILRDPREEISNLFSIYGLPATFLVDREGILVWRRIGPLRADEEALRRVLERTLDG